MVSYTAIPNSQRALRPVDHQCAVSSQSACAEPHHCLHVLRSSLGWIGFLVQASPKRDMEVSISSGEGGRENPSTPVRGGAHIAHGEHGDVPRLECPGAVSTVGSPAVAAPLPASPPAAAGAGAGAAAMPTAIRHAPTSAAGATEIGSAASCDRSGAL
ncbi:MAG: hypothetical protein EOO65_02580 [Methanosarcinales archaeon]|nr:MAG: hypothetical protein EOO65_02580 [Methanosarcinales archaeon]